MSLPTLELLAASGRKLALVGKPWASALFAAYPWPVLALPNERLRRIRQMREQFAPGSAALLLTNSFGSALDLRLGGLRPIGYATDARRWLLTQAIAVPARWHQTAAAPMHMVEYYYELARALLGAAPPVPASLSLRVADAATDRAKDLLRAAGIKADYVMLCPVAVGRHRGQVKAWAGFGQLGAALQANGMQVVVCPGPGERAAVLDAVPSATLLAETDVATFAALLAGSRLVVANDSGSAHLAAAVGAPLVTIFGVTSSQRTGPWSPQAIEVGSENGWPSFDQVSAAVDQILGRK